MVVFIASFHRRFGGRLVHMQTKSGIRSTFNVYVNNTIASSHCFGIFDRLPLGLSFKTDFRQRAGTTLCAGS